MVAHPRGAQRNPLGVSIASRQKAGQVKCSGVKSGRECWVISCAHRAAIRRSDWIDADRCSRHASCFAAALQRHMRDRVAYIECAFRALPAPSAESNGLQAATRVSFRQR